MTCQETRISKVWQGRKKELKAFQPLVCHQRLLPVLLILLFCSFAALIDPWASAIHDLRSAGTDALPPVSPSSRACRSMTSQADRM